MTGDEHLDLDTLADYAEDLIKDPEEAAGIRAHVGSCSACRDRMGRLAGVRDILSAQTAPSMPRPVVSRIQEALAAESRDRQVVPLESRRRRRRPGQLAGVAASVALVLVGSVWGIQAMRTGGTGGAPATMGTSSSRDAAAPMAAPSVEPSRAAASTTVSGRHYSSRRLPDQVSDLLREKRGDGGVSVRAARPTPDRLRPLATPAKLASCVSQVTKRPSAGDVLTIDLARYSGKPSAVIVTSDSRDREAEVWVVDPSCSVRTHAEVDRPGG